MKLEIDVHSVQGLDEKERAALSRLIKTYTEHQGKNLEKERYYEGRIPALLILELPCPMA